MVSPLQNPRIGTDHLIQSLLNARHLKLEHDVQMEPLSTGCRITEMEMPGTEPKIFHLQIKYCTFELLPPPQLTVTADLDVLRSYKSPVPLYLI